MPGNQNDARCVEQIQKDMNAWKLGNVIWAMDQGITSGENRKILQKDGGQGILGEKLRRVCQPKMSPWGISSSWKSNRLSAR